MSNLVIPLHKTVFFTNSLFEEMKKAGYTEQHFDDLNVESSPIGIFLCIFDEKFLLFAEKQVFDALEENEIIQEAMACFYENPITKFTLPDLDGEIEGFGLF